jgi:asparagine synthase (glutamine-hydrolysing)
MTFTAGACHFDHPADSGRAPQSPAGPISFDGRLDNRAGLLLRLREVLGHHASGDTSDAALALAAYRRWGVDGFAHLIGDWSLAIWDEREEALILASDFAGVRPLYYCVQPHRVLWSARLGPLVDGAQAGEIDDTFAAGFLAIGGYANRTPFRNISSVPPGYAVRVTKAGAELRQFWKLPIGNTIRYRRESDYEEHLRALFREAVSCRLRTGAPVLAELSGGLDSSSIVCMGSNLIESGEAAAPRLLTVSYEHPDSVDARFYKTIEQHCGVEGIHVPTSDYPFVTETDPGGGTPAFWGPLHAHAGSIAGGLGAETYLTGRMGDLIMGNWGDDSDQVAGLLRTGRFGTALRQSLAWSKALRIPITWVLWRSFLLSLPRSLSPTRTPRQGDGNNVPCSHEDSIIPAFRKRTGVTDPQACFSPAWMQAPPERRKHFRGLAETLELRKLQPPEPLQHLLYTHPYAHRPLVEFMFSIPADIVCRPGEPRRLMRRAFHDLWPPELRRRRSKDSFGGVFLEALRPLAQMLLAQPRLQVVERGYLEPSSLKARLQQLTQSLDCNEPQLRQVILLELWLRARDGAGVDAPACLTLAAP